MFEVLIDFECFKKGDKINGALWGKQLTDEMVNAGYVKPVTEKKKAPKEE